MIVIHSKKGTLRTYIVQAHPRAPNHLSAKLPENLLESQLEASTEKCFHCTLGSSAFVYRSTGWRSGDNVQARCQWIARVAEEDLGTSDLAAQYSSNTMCNIPGGEMDPWDYINRRALTHREPSLRHWRKNIGKKTPLAHARRSSAGSLPASCDFCGASMAAPGCRTIRRMRRQRKRR